MKRSDFASTVRLLKTSIEEEKDWLGEDLMTDATPVRSQQGAVDGQRSVPGPSSPPTAMALESYRAEICGCTRCPLGASRIHFVFGVGDPHARLMFVGEGPGYDEDRKGEPFVGRAGQLLNKIIEAMGYRREDVYIANIVKCHPMKDPGDPEKRGNDRPPSEEEMDACMPYLTRQIDIIRPAVICTLGSTASRGLLRVETPISHLRGKFVDFGPYKLMPTYHPAALLRNPALKRDVWEDMKQITRFLSGS